MRLGSHGPGGSPESPPSTSPPPVPCAPACATISAPLHADYPRPRRPVRRARRPAAGLRSPSHRIDAARRCDFVGQHRHASVRRPLRARAAAQEWRHRHLLLRGGADRERGLRGHVLAVRARRGRAPGVGADAVAGRRRHRGPEHRSGAAHPQLALTHGRAPVLGRRALGPALECTVERGHVTRSPRHAHVLRVRGRHRSHHDADGRSEGSATTAPTTRPPASSGMRALASSDHREPGGPLPAGARHRGRHRTVARRAWGAP